MSKLLRIKDYELFKIKEEAKKSITRLRASEGTPGGFVTSSDVNRNLNLSVDKMRELQDLLHRVSKDSKKAAEDARIAAEKASASMVSFSKMLNNTIKIKNLNGGSFKISMDFSSLSKEDIQIRPTL